jgi:hypothetical protein
MSENHASPPKTLAEFRAAWEVIEATRRLRDRMELIKNAPPPSHDEVRAQIQGCDDYNHRAIQDIDVYGIEGPAH